MKFLFIGFKTSDDLIYNKCLEKVRRIDFDIEEKTKGKRNSMLI